MLTLRDFFHLPELDKYVKSVLQTRSGMILLTGWSPAAGLEAGVEQGLLPSGRAAVLGVILNEYLAALPGSRVVYITRSKSSARVDGAFRSRVAVSQVNQSRSYPVQIEAAAHTKPDLLVIDELVPDNLYPAFMAARNGQLVLSQFDTFLHGIEVLRQLEQFGVDSIVLEGLVWLICIERQPGLCTECRQPDSRASQKLEQLTKRYPDLVEEIQRLAAEAGEPLVFYRASQCKKCKRTGREGEVTIFGIYPQSSVQVDGPLQPAEFTRQAYMLNLAARGNLALDDILFLEADIRQRLYAMLLNRETSLLEANTQLRKRLVELEAANLVLQQRTEQLISLESISQLLIASDDLPALAERVCRRLNALCRADFIVLYALRQSPMTDDEMEILAVSGWPQTTIGRKLSRRLFDRDLTPSEPHPFRGLPQGLSVIDLSAVGLYSEADLQAGLCLPIFAQETPVGMMIVQSTRKSTFTPGERALLSTFASQAAMAMQRSGLIQSRIDKEKLEKEMELARRLQQSLLPKQFPEVPGFRFAAANQPARWVGGDFYDVFRLDDRYLGLVIGDASDKGMPAALYMALTRSLILAEARRSTSTSEVLRAVNRVLLDLGTLQGYVTVLFGVLNTETNLLTYSRAGHDRPYLYRSGYLHMLSGDGMLLGMFPDDEFLLAEDQIHLLSGDRLILYTDGLTDIVDEQGKILEQKTFEDILHASLEQGGPQSLCAEVLSRLAGYQGNAEQFDDQSLLIIQVD
jgi:phosphoserine phosphatase RsbU/P